MHQSVYELVHTEDQQELRRNLHWALNPPAAASTITQDSPHGDHSLHLHESIIKRTKKLRDPGRSEQVSKLKPRKHQSKALSYLHGVGLLR